MSPQASQLQLIGAAESLATCQPTSAQPDTAHSSAVAAQVMSTSDTVPCNPEKLQLPTHEVMWCPDLSCPRHKCFDNFSGWTNWHSLHDHVLRQHRKNADTLLATAKRTVVTRYWCTEPDCPRRHGSDSGFEGWLEYRSLTSHMSVHAKAQARGLTAYKPAAAARTSQSRRTARQPGSVPTNGSATAACTVAAVLPVGGKFWCPQMDCPKRYGSGNDFAGYCSVQSLQTHLNKVHKNTQTGAQDDSDVPSLTAAAANDCPSSAKSPKIGGRFWCPDPDCAKSHSTDNGFRGYSSQDSVHAHRVKAHHNPPQHAAAEPAATLSALGADPDRLNVQLGKRDIQLDAAIGFQADTAEPASERRRGRAKKHVASPLAATPPHDAFASDADAGSVQLDLDATRVADADSPQLGKATAMVADGAQHDALLPIIDWFFCPDPTCPKSHGSDSGFCGYTARSSLDRHIRDKHQNGPQTSSVAHTDCRTGHSEVSAEPSLPDGATVGAVDETVAGQKLVPEVEADDAGPCNALLSSKRCFWCPDLNCPKRHSLDGFAGFHRLTKLQMHINKQRRKQNGHHSLACTKIVARAKSHSRTPPPAQTSTSVADVHPSSLFRSPQHPATAPLAGQPEALSAAAVQMASIPTSDPAMSADGSPKLAVPAQLALASDHNTSWVAAQKAGLDGSSTQAAVPITATVLAATAASSRLEGHIKLRDVREGVSAVLRPLTATVNGKHTCIQNTICVREDALPNYLTDPCKLVSSIASVWLCQWNLECSHAECTNPQICS